MRVENVKRGPLSDSPLLDDAGKHELLRLNLSCRRGDLGLGSIELPQAATKAWRTWARAESRSSRRWPSVSLNWRTLAATSPPW